LGDRKDIRTLEKMCHLSGEVSFQNSWREKTEGVEIQVYLETAVKQKAVVYDPATENMLLVTSHFV